MADFLPVSVHVKALFVPKRNGVSKEAKLYFRVSQQRCKRGIEQNQGQGKKLANNTPEDINFQFPQNLNLDLPTSVRLHWSLPHALTGNVAEEQTTSFPVISKYWLLTHRGRSDGKLWIARNHCLPPAGKTKAAPLRVETHPERRILPHPVSFLGRNMSPDG